MKFTLAQLSSKRSNGNTCERAGLGAPKEPTNDFEHIRWTTRHIQHHQREHGRVCPAKGWAASIIGGDTTLAAAQPYLAMENALDQ
jgi:hypothetical protein